MFCNFAGMLHGYAKNNCFLHFTISFNKSGKVFAHFLGSIGQNDAFFKLFHFVKIIWFSFVRYFDSRAFLNSIFNIYSVFINIEFYFVKQKVCKKPIVNSLCHAVIVNGLIILLWITKIFVGVY